MTVLQDFRSRRTDKGVAWLIRRGTMMGPERIQNVERLGPRVDETADWFQKT